LYKKSLEIFANDSVNYPKALLQYADFLDSNKEYEEAAALYLMARNDARSLECYKRSTCWQEAFLIAHKLNFSLEELNQLGSELMASLVETSRYDEAARIAIDYQLNIELGIEILSLGGFWNEAMRIGMKFNIPQVLQRIVEPKMLQSLQYLLDDIKDISNSFSRDKAKLLQVNKQNARKVELANDPNLENIDLQSDTFSMATTFISGTSFSNMSSRTARTAKQKRKMERKKAAGKVGEFQEEFLQESLRKCVEKGNALQGIYIKLIVIEDVARRLKFMIIHGYFSQAQALQTEFGNVLDLMQDSIPDIFAKNNQITLEEVKQKWFNDPQSLTNLPEHKPPPTIFSYKWKVDFIP
jgi:elongator complex protein 1